MEDSTAQALQAAIAFADALIEHGADIHGQWHNWLQFGETEQIEALKGHPEKLENHRLNLQAALDALSTPVQA